MFGFKDSLKSFGKQLLICIVLIILFVVFFFLIKKSIDYDTGFIEQFKNTINKKKVRFEPEKKKKSKNPKIKKSSKSENKKLKNPEITPIVEKKESGSKGERECRRVMEEIFKVPFPSTWPDWLRNPKTNRRLELDCYNEDVGIAVEYHGEQHYVYPHKFHKNIEAFDKQIYRDQIKLDMCDERGVYLITVPYTEKIENIEDYIIYYLPANRKERLDAGLTT